MRCQQGWTRTSTLENIYPQMPDFLSGWQKKKKNMVWTLSNALDKKELVGDLVEGRAEIEHPTSALRRPGFQYKLILAVTIRTPGNCGKGLIPKIGFLSGCLLAKFVRVVPGLPYIFLLLSGSSDQGVFSPRIVRIAYLRLSGPPKSGWPSKRADASESLCFSTSSES